MTTPGGSGAARAARRDRVHREAAARLAESGVPSRRRTARGAAEWSAMQALGHGSAITPRVSGTRRDDRGERHRGVSHTEEHRAQGRAALRG
jgi:hypothetical protein